MEHQKQDRFVSRRGLLKMGAVVSASIVSSGISEDQLQARSGVKLANTGTPRNIHVSLAAYSVRQALTNGRMDLFDFIDWCAEMDLRGTELTSYYFKEGFDKAYLHQLKLRAFRQGVIISGTAVRNNFCLPPGEERDRNIAHVKQWIDHSAELFAPHIRIFAGSVPKGVDKNTAIVWVADCAKYALDYAAWRGVVLGLENHGGITARAADHLAICNAVGEHPWFGVNLDTGNFRSDPYRELAIVASRSVNVQIKVQVTNREGQRVPADFERIQKILKDVGYKGWVALEYEAQQDPFTEIPLHLVRLKELFES